MEEGGMAGRKKDKWREGGREGRVMARGMMVKKEEERGMAGRSKENQNVSRRFQMALLLVTATHCNTLQHTATHCNRMQDTK